MKAARIRCVRNPRSPSPRTLRAAYPAVKRDGA